MSESETENASILTSLSGQQPNRSYLPGSRSRSSATQHRSTGSWPRALPSARKRTRPRPVSDGILHWARIAHSRGVIGHSTPIIVVAFLIAWARDSYFRRLLVLQFPPDAEQQLETLIPAITANFVEEQRS